jgi:hypothetical protein
MLYVVLSTLSCPQLAALYLFKGLAPAGKLSCCSCSLHPTLQVLAFLASEAAADANNVLTMCMRLGDTNFHVMKLLDEGHTGK